MKDIFKIIVFIIILLIVLAQANFYFKERNKNKNQNASTPAQTVITPVQPDSPATQQPNPPQAVNQPQPQIGNQPSANNNAGTGVSVNMRAKYEQAARNTQCRLINFQQAGSSATVTLESGDRNNLGAFLDECIKMGIMRDFDDLNQFKMIQKNGKTFCYASYKVRW